MTVSLSKRSAKETSGTRAAPPSADGAWRSIVPLWEVALSGWFVYSVDGRLLYANPAVRSVASDAEEESTDFLLDVAPSARPTVRRVFHQLRSGQRASSSVIVPIVVRDQLTPVVLSMTLVGDAPDEPIVLGNVTKVFSVGTGEVVEQAEHESAERALERIMAEVAAVLPEAAPTATAPNFEDLSVRQNEILGLILAGHDTEGISRRLHLSRHTVRNHTQAILRCLGVHSQADLIAYCRARQTHPSGRSVVSASVATAAARV